MAGDEALLDSIFKDTFGAEILADLNRPSPFLSYAMSGAVSYGTNYGGAMGADLPAWNLGAIVIPPPAPQPARRQMVRTFDAQKPRLYGDDY